MFKIEKLILYGLQEGQDYCYDFSEGINFFVGKNGSGKTEFYYFLDYMFGSSIQLNNKEWFNGSLKAAEMHVTVNKLKFILVRYINDLTKNYFCYADETAGEPILLDEYKEKINMIFSPGEDKLKDLHRFVGEEIGYRTFTLFNFLGETRQGILNDFFDKASDIRYAVKLPALLNYIFNKNVAEIDKLKQEEAELLEELEKLEHCSEQNKELKARTNKQLSILGISKEFSGKNRAEILEEIRKYQDVSKKEDVIKKERTIAELEAVYSSLDDQIKVQLKMNSDAKSFQTASEKQKKLLDALAGMIAQDSPYGYLAEQLSCLTQELDQSITFNKYLIKENTIEALKKERNRIKNQLMTEQSKYRLYSVSDKSKAITLVQDYLSFYDDSLSNEDVNSVRAKLKSVREKIRTLQNSNDIEKIDGLSKEITSLYYLAQGVSDLAEFDFGKNGFRIEYIKNGNTLQPRIIESDEGKDTVKNYYTGSMARHTLMQLCGYLAFLKLLCEERKYPLIPMLVIDHISKPFDSKNEKAIGAVLHGIYKKIETENLQVFIFDDKDPSSLDIVPNKTHNLVEEGKSGFNPYYYKPSPDDKIDQ